MLQPLELWAFDTFMQLRPPESIDEQILIVGIDEKDIQSVGTYPVPDAQLADLIEQLQASQPIAIGLDIVRDLPVEPGHARLIEAFRTANVFGIEQARSNGIVRTKPPPALPPERVGFADLIVDDDGTLRRALLGTPTGTEYKLSLPLLLMERYLSDRGFVMESSDRDEQTVRFGSTEFTRFRNHSGGYVNANDYGNQILINYRSSKSPFHVVSLTDVLQERVDSALIHDRIILIGMTAASAGDIVQSPYGETYGVKIHAQIVSQMLSSVLQGRPLLNVWSDRWEYFWILGWGVLGISLARFFVSPLTILAGLIASSVLLIGVSYAALVAGWWLPVAPVLLVLVLNGAGLTASLFYRYQQDLQARLRDRQLVIEQIYTAVHNIPVQTLKGILSSVRQGNASPNHFHEDLERLEQELRAIEESVRQEILAQDNLHLCGGVKLNLQHPLHQLLHEVYRATVMRSRDFHACKT
ncbi:MAG: CHASE2 domain-containing protein [Leptolyngbyaceae cyanobacterium SM1_3_5]|nr:CHASE2 domain-containing protein [Leptolyngbyaceae cyanobacterium SM1_3_5]